MHRTILIATLATAGALAAASPAAAAPLPNGERVGGGNAGTRSQDVDGRDLQLSFEGRSGGDLRVRASGIARCPRVDVATGDDLSILHSPAQGTAIRVDRTRRVQIDGRRFTFRHRIRGTVEDTGGSGTYRLRASFRSTAGRLVRCDSGSVT